MIELKELKLPFVTYFNNIIVTKYNIFVIKSYFIPRLSIILL